MKIRFNNGTEVPYIEAINENGYMNGVNRQVLSVHIAKGVIGVDELDAILSDENNTQHIELIGDEVTNVFDDYILKNKVGVEKVLIENETPDAPTLYEERIVFELGRLTYIEKRLKSLGL